METQHSCGNEVETDFGTRALNKQNNNKTIVVPRICLENLGSNLDKMNVSLVQKTNGKKFIKLESPDSEIESKDMGNNEDE
jgi:hypothetical protein